MPPPPPCPYPPCTFPPPLPHLAQNELGILEFIHAFVETLDRYFENVCELDIMFNIEKAHFILDEMVMNGVIVETNKCVGWREVHGRGPSERALPSILILTSAPLPLFTRSGQTC